MGDKMKNYLVGFLAGVGLCLSVYIGWEHYRHVPVIIQEIKVPVPVPVPIPVPVPAEPPVSVEPPMRVA
jgi:hypothetical protein